MNYYLSVLQKYAVFEGRASRTEFWMFVLINIIISILLGVVSSFIKIPGANYLSSLYSLVVLLPSLAVGARRLHDTDRSGWWQLIGLIPLIGWIVLIVFWAMSGQPGDNQHGPVPQVADDAPKPPQA